VAKVAALIVIPTTIPIVFTVSADPVAFGLVHDSQGSNRVGFLTVRELDESQAQSRP